MLTPPVFWSEGIYRGDLRAHFASQAKSVGSTDARRRRRVNWLFVDGQVAPVDALFLDGGLDGGDDAADGETLDEDASQEFSLNLLRPFP